MNYQLRDELQPAHLQDVKAVLSIDQDTIASASRDGSVAVWRQKENVNTPSPYLYAVIYRRGLSYKPF